MPPPFTYFSSKNFPKKDKPSKKWVFISGDYLLVGINQTVVFGHRAKTNVFNKKTTTRYPYAGFCGIAQRARRLGIGSSCVMGALREGTCVEKWY